MKWKFLFLSLLVASTTFISCDEEETSGNSDVNTFQFDADGVPYSNSSSIPLSSEVQTSIREVVVGNGWMLKSTREIKKDGSLAAGDYWDGLDGAGPNHFLINSDTLLTRYFYCDACMGADVYSKMKISIDYNTGLVKDENGVMFGVWSVYKESGVWHMKVVEYLGCQATSFDACTAIWGSSEYVMMNESELKEVQDMYDVDYNALAY